MKKIFRNKYLAILIGCIMVAPVACDDSYLQIPIAGSLSESQLVSQAGLEKLLIGVYANLNGRDSWHGGSTNWMWGSMRGADANKGTNAGDFNSMNPVENYAVETTNTEVEAKWNKSFEGISRANRLIALIPQVTDASDDVKKRIEGEAKFLRGFYYFELKKTFSNAPYVDETLDLATGASKVPNNQDLWPMIEADFTVAWNNLPETLPEAGRVNKWAAGAFLAKAYLFQGKWTAARDLFLQIVAEGQTTNGLKYALVDNFGALFRLAGENSAESVFAFQATGAAKNVNNANQELAMAFPYNTLPGNCCGFFTPSFELASSYRVDANGLPLLDNSFRLPANELKNDEGLVSSAPFTPDAGLVDPRLDVTIGRRGIPFLDWGPHKGYDWIRDQSYSGPYSPKKYTYSSAEASTNDGSGWTPGYTAINFMLMRYSDVLLMLAEAQIMSGDLEAGRDLINQVRTRAANTSGWVKSVDGSTYAANYKVGTYDAAFADQAAALKALRFERKLELSMEGHRFFDLVRWGTADAELNAYIAYDGPKIPSHFIGVQFNVGKDELLPIPQHQIDLQTAAVLTQNPGY